MIPACAAIEANSGPQQSKTALPATPCAPGTILYDGQTLCVFCGEQSLLPVARVKLEGRKEVSATDFANGAHVQSGEQFISR